MEHPASLLQQFTHALRLIHLLVSQGGWKQLGEQGSLCWFFDLNFFLFLVSILSFLYMLISLRLAVFGFHHPRPRLSSTVHLQDRLDTHFARYHPFDEQFVLLDLPLGTSRRRMKEGHMVRPETEILVHIAAPARAADDVRHRALARAYLDFEPSNVTEVQARARGEVEGDTQLNRREFVGYGIHQAPPSSQLNRGIKSPILSFQSAEHNFDSPGLRAVPVTEHCISETQSSWQAPPSEIPDSMPNNHPPFEIFCTPSRALDFFTSSLDSQHVDSSPLARRRSQRLATASESGRYLCSQPRRSPRRPNIRQAPGAPETGSLQPSSLPEPSLPRLRIPSIPPQSSSYPGSTRDPINNRPLRARPHSSLDRELHLPSPSDPANKIIPQSPDICVQKRPPPQPSQLSTSDIIEETVLYSSNPNQTSVPCSQEPPALARADSEPIAKRRRTAADPQPGQPLTRSTSDIGPRRQPLVQLISNKPTAYYKSKLQIYAPSPPAAQTDLRPEDVISPVLAKLATELDLSVRFRPQSQTRELRPFERGYWLVETASWPADLKLSAWMFLTDYIEKGIAGWGTSCSRDQDFRWLRLRCWGCVVGHMHLLLYVASRRQVKDMGMKWFGGDGEAVVVMAPR